MNWRDEMDAQAGVRLAGFLDQLREATAALGGETKPRESMADALFPFVPRFLMLATSVGAMRCPECDNMPGCVHRLARQLVEDVTARVKAGP